MKAYRTATRFLESLNIPEGPRAGEAIKLAPFQKSFVRGALDHETQIAVLSIGRGNAKTALSAGIALGALLGEWDRQPRREILIAARTRDQARVAWDFVAGFARTLPEETQKALTFRRSPRLEIEFEGDGGGHFVRALAADANRRWDRRRRWCSWTSAGIGRSTAGTTLSTRFSPASASGGARR